MKGNWITFAGAILAAIITALGGWAAGREESHKLQGELDTTKANLERMTSDLKKAQDTIKLFRKSTPPSGAKKPTLLEGRYEWQWADDGWRGYVTVDENGAATLDMNQIIGCPDKRKQVPITKQGPSGSMRLLSGEKVHVKIPVTFVKYAPDCTGKDDPGPTLLEGDLSAYTTYAGTVTYKGPDGKTSHGDMVLVKGWISGVHDNAGNARIEPMISLARLKLREAFAMVKLVPLR
jgi:hypothetical protein